LTAALGLDGYIRAAAAAEDVTAGKPDPAIFLAAASILGVAPSRCVVVEDVAAGVEAARRAGMVSIGLSRNGPPLDATLPVTTLETLAPEDFERLLIRASSK
jgi:beta-phosphoglucomutase-like phosphatase (HAD superfamily)